MLELSPYQLRLLGCLLEKEVTTPEQYPLTLNALTMAVNQKTNREPVYELTEAQVFDTIEQLKEKRLVSDLVGFGSRVTKYQHRFCNTEFGSLQFSAQEKAIICVLFLRGPQTPGELRTRTHRLCEFANVQEVEVVLTQLTLDGTLIQLPREAGKREHRYFHCFAPKPVQTQHEVPTASNAVSKAPKTLLDERVKMLEEEVATLKKQVAVLLTELDISFHDES